MGLTGALARKSFLSLILIALVGVGGGRLAGKIPGGFVPVEDQGIMMVNVQLPQAASLERTRAVAAKVEQILRETPGVESYNVIGGMSFLSSTFSPSAASFFVRLKPWAERTTPETGLRGLVMGLNQRLGALPEAVAFPFVPPTLPGFGAAGGFNVLLQDRSGNLTVAELGAQTQAFLAAAAKRPELARLFTAFDPGVPQIALEVDREKARTLGVPLPDVFPPCRPRWAVPTSTTSTASAASTACLCRPRPTSARSRRTSASSTCAAAPPGP
jgi:multidrug efflux pump subunit AcrB